MSNNQFPNRRHFLKATAVTTAAGLILPQTNGIVTAQGVTTAQPTKSVLGTKTEQNLLKAFAGESQARNRYIFFADQARKENLEQIAAIFEETAHHEQEHARRFFSFLEGGPLEITATYPAGKVGTTEQNLQASADGEHEEWAEIYPAFAKIAESEGFPLIARLFTAVSVSERFHENRYRDFIKNIEEGIVYERDDDVVWVCRNCGFTSKNTMPPPTCPACGKPKTQFQIFTPNW